MTSGASAPVHTFHLGPARVRFTGRSEGDMGHGGEYAFDVHPEVAARRQAVVALPWVWLRQVHGNGVVVVRSPAEAAGLQADAAVTSYSQFALAVLVADCAPVALASPEGVIGAVHAGWMGLANGVIERTVERMSDLGATRIEGLLGPCIHPECYEFGARQLERLTGRYGAGVAGSTSAGRPALDIPAAVRSALAAVGVESLGDVSVCTACSPDHFSWRARRDPGRQAMVVWQ